MVDIPKTVSMLFNLQIVLVTRRQTLVPLPVPLLSETLRLLLLPRLLLLLAYVYCFAWSMYAKNKPSKNKNPTMQPTTTPTIELVETPGTSGFRAGKVFFGDGAAAKVVTKLFPKSIVVM